MSAPQGKAQLKTSFKVVHSLASIYTGGKVALTTDGKLLVTTVQEDIDVIEVDTGRRVHQLKGDTEIVTSFAVTPSDQFLVSASRSLQIKVWDLSTGKAVRNWKGHDAPVIVMTIDSTSTLVATGSADSTVKIWDVARGYCTHNFRGHGGVVSALLFHIPLNPTGRGPGKEMYLFSGSEDCTVRMWDLHTRKSVAVLDGHVSVVRGLTVTGDGKKLVSGGRDKIVHVWDLERRKKEKAYTVFESIEAVGVLKEGTVLPDGSIISASRNIIYTGGEKGYLQFWDLRNGECIYKQDASVNTKHSLTDVIYSPSTSTLVSITSDQNILFNALQTDLPRTRQVVGYNDEVVDLTFLEPTTPNASTAFETHLAVATNSEQIRVYSLQRFDCSLLYGHKDIVLCLDRSKDGSVLVSGSKDRTARLWSLAPERGETEELKYRPVGLCSGHTEAIGAVAMSRKGRTFMITGSQDRTVKFWDLTKLDLTNPDENFHPKSVYTHKAHDKDINAIAVAPNDKLFATGSQDKTAKIWSVADGKLLGTCTGHKRGVWSLEFSPVDQCLATASGDKTVKLWSVADFSCLKTFEGHTNTVLKVHFLTSGMQLVSSGSDGLVKLWTIRTSECAATLDNHTEKVWALAVRGDEKVIASGGADSVVNFWEDFTEAEKVMKEKEREEIVEKEQDLQNYLLKRDYRNAIMLAMSLGQPGRLLTLFSNVLAARPEGDKSVTGSAAVDLVLANMSVSEIEKLLTYIRDWNTNAKRSFTAQTILQAILRTFDPERLTEIKNLKELLNGIIPYTERHLARADALLQQSYIVDYSVKEMDAILGVIDNMAEQIVPDEVDQDMDIDDIEIDVGIMPTL